MSEVDEPVLKTPTGWEQRAPAGWEWQTLWEAVEEGDHKYSDKRVREAIEAGINPRVILDDGLFPGFDLQGDRFSANIIFIPEMLVTARAMKVGLALIRPLLKAAKEKPVGTFVMGTVLGDMHDIGQSIVTIMLENAGFEVINLGTDVHPDRFISTALENKADLVGFSALLSTTVYYQKVTIEEFQKAGHRNKVKILIGGAPTSQEWADSCGADGWGRDAVAAVKLALRLVSEAGSLGLTMGSGSAVTFITVAGLSAVVRIGADATLLDAARAAGMDMDATCGGRGRCRSCRVKVLSGEISPPTLQDTLQLGHDEVKERFRLACQTHAVSDCTITPMPPKAESGFQILAGKVDVGAESGLRLDSGVTKHLITAKTPVGEHHQTSDVEEILSCLPPTVDRHLSLELLRKVPAALRKDKGRLTVTTFNSEVVDIEVGDTTAHSYGMAFDIGTTSIVGTLMDLATGEQIAAVGGLNPQAQYGGDLMSRIAYAQFDDIKLATLRGKVLTGINAFIKEACDKANVSSERIYKIVVVGNTCMHHVFLGIDVSYVGLAPYAPAIRDPLVYSAREVPLKAAPNAKVCLLPIVAGFVGADTMACVLATRIYESEEIRALVDIGTNGEVVMGSRGRLFACSAPAGPALEGAQIRHGMRGALGAIERVEISNDVACKVIGDTPAIGICGSGLIDACAKMLDASVIDANGLLRRESSQALAPALQRRISSGEGGREFVLVWKEEAGRGHDISVTQADIRQLQLAKSAIYSGIIMLRDVMGIRDDEIHELMLCGGFGNYISIESSVKIRLLPELPVDRITYMGNAAAIGAQMALLSETERLRAFELAQKIEHVALAARPEFQSIFVDGMNFSGETFAAQERRKRTAAQSAIATPETPSNPASTAARLGADMMYRPNLLFEEETAVNLATGFGAGGKGCA